MAERDDVTGIKGNNNHRSAEEIRQEIIAEREVLSETVDQIGDLIQEKLEWRGYIRRSPYLALGAAAGAGFLVSKMYKQRTPPLQRLLDAVAGSVAKTGNQGIVKMTLYAVASKLAMRWIQNAVSEGVLNEPSVRESTPPGTGMSDYSEPSPSSPGPLVSHQPL